MLIQCILQKLCYFLQAPASIKNNKQIRTEISFMFQIRHNTEETILYSRSSYCLCLHSHHTKWFVTIRSYSTASENMDDSLLRDICLITCM